MKEENNILRKVGTKNLFSVPENYFENFTQELMTKLPEKETLLPNPEPTLWQRVKPWIYMTAMFCGIMLSVKVFVGNPQTTDLPISQITEEDISDEDWEIIRNRLAVDDYELYEYLTDAETDFYQ